MKTTTVVIPVKNEEAGLRYLLEDFKIIRSQYDGALKFIFVIDSTSSDESTKIAKLFEGEILFQYNTTGKGSAIRMGIEKWKEDPTGIIVFLDGDGSYSFGCVLNIIATVQSGYDVVSGSRFLGNDRSLRGMSSLHVFGNRLLSKISSIKNRRSITDLCTGLWGFSEEALLKLKIKSNGFDLEAELAGLISRNQLKNIEIPVKWEQRKGGVSKLRSLRDGMIIFARILTT